MNNMRVPALQTLLLYAKYLDTNADCTRIICDSWLEIRFLDADSAQRIVSAILYLRSSLDKLFHIRLEDHRSEQAEQMDNDSDPIGVSTKHGIRISFFIKLPFGIS